ncbi:MAG TPA: hypothetical protein VK195_06160, partial [Burkholderiaceae bacterium]|nr:hypothetical protein [Burkholderiaceae bacterium]
RGLGELAPELLPALLQACDAGLVLDAPGPDTTHLWPELACLSPGAGLPLLATPLAELRGAALRGLRIVEDVPALVDAVEALPHQPRRRAPRALTRAGLAGERALVRALLALLEAGRPWSGPAAQDARRCTLAASGSAVPASARGR